MLRVFRILIGLIFSICVSFVQALDIHMEQQPRQGALLYGTTDASRIEFQGRSIDVDAEGRFVFGIGRDAPPELTLHVYGKADSDRELSKVVVFEVQQRTYATQSIEGVDKKYVSPPPEVTERIRNDAVKVKRARSIFTRDQYDYLASFIWPAEGPVSGVYGSQRVFNGVPKRPHYGLDIAAPTGTPVVAPASGTVTLAESNLYYSGGTLILDHGRGVSSTFIHLSKIHVEVGDYVKQGELIADIGATGRVTGAHLDWRINWFNQRLDPQLLLPERSPANVGK